MIYSCRIHTALFFDPVHQICCWGGEKKKKNRGSQSIGECLLFFLGECKSCHAVPVSKFHLSTLKHFLRVMEARHLKKTTSVYYEDYVCRFSAQCNHVTKNEKAWWSPFKNIAAINIFNSENMIEDVVPLEFSVSQEESNLMQMPFIRSTEHTNTEARRLSVLFSVDPWLSTATLRRKYSHGCEMFQTQPL